MQFEKNHDGPIEHSLEIALETIEGVTPRQVSALTSSSWSSIAPRGPRDTRDGKGKPADDYETTLKKSFPE